jgi:hypothetical protein
MLLNAAGVVPHLQLRLNYTMNLKKINTKGSSELLGKRRLATDFILNTVALLQNNG